MTKSKSSSCFCFNSKCCDDNNSDKDSDHSTTKEIAEKDPRSSERAPVLKSNSVPIGPYQPINIYTQGNTGISPNTISPNTNDTSLSGSSHNGKVLQSSSEDRQQDLASFKQGIKNTELLNSGGVIEANHKYVSRVLMPNGGSQYSHPVSRASSVKMPYRNLRLSSEVLNEGSTIGSRGQIVRRNTERIRTRYDLEAEQNYQSLKNSEEINTGRTIEAEHTYLTHVAIPSSGYYPLPRYQTNSLRRPIHLILYPTDGLMRKESWYRSGDYLSRTRQPISRTRSLGFQL